ncbi:MAG: hypothetical protein DRR16_04800 [Candidatus Parabeggiatoa sp. nov. 3]|nr:MAG: hypothetical protein DRR00_04855 [Gammaproteobacteria bacterium]RKZ68801.1 MAG: hypothetical protein DRQ99_02830 [Gammaproteobacteria bacterium]RKZ88507.1 MAG: hypothetical protein DRR16_04800 [Gammaproteobacteria bacterium]HEW98386.1 hypothetical protein [Beggiatoa sp.]
MNNQKIPKALIDLLRTAQRVVVLTGAGTWAESGVPTFRDAQTGLWARYDPKEWVTCFCCPPSSVVQKQIKAK